MDLRDRFKGYLSTIRTYNKIASIAKITRRYFAINGFDGVITSIGILLGNYIINVDPPVAFIDIVPFNCLIYILTS